MLLPSSDLSLALAKSVHRDVEVRDAGWQWLAEVPPGGSRSRVLVLLDDNPSALTDVLKQATLERRRDATVALLGIDGFDIRLAPLALRTVLIEALLKGTPDEQHLGRSLQVGTLQETASQVTMEP